METKLLQLRERAVRRRSYCAPAALGDQQLQSISRDETNETRLQGNHQRTLNLQYSSFNARNYKDAAQLLEEQSKLA